MFGADDSLAVSLTDTSRSGSKVIITAQPRRRLQSNALDFEDVMCLLGLTLSS